MGRPLGKDTIVRIRAPLAVSERGNTPYRDWANATEVPIENCNVQAAKLSDKLRFEEDREREHHVSFYRVWAPAGSDIEYTDRIRFDGKIHEVQGDSADWRRLSGNPHHVAFLMKLREG